MTLEEMQAIDRNGYVDVECPECGDWRRIEPDGDYPCHTALCNGRVVSPLIEEGLI